ncbi:hypothetical protein Dsin_026349 [Dipteronia sinensis]|uniref:Pectinesterase n=1 Tax=Dipteronia sinensis TaxID=43782 RepID=A0AAD9ZY09_9ROSI|nr:hypothetical protein Dsin_026349 [Dipteronia sinensis]
MSYKKCTQVDKQTWLSTALTNLGTCRTGFVELGVSDNLLPLMSNNVSKLISNALSLNKTPSPASRANIVVAKDGSGNFKTIKEAVTAASKRSGTGRYVIYIKSGTYNENIELGTKPKNIMFLGDGMGKTIVTGSRSVVGGSTTFKSATVGKVKWRGHHVLTSATDANKFTVGNFLAGSSWLPTTVVPFTPGL